MTAERAVSVVGLGYVGLPVAVAFGRHARTIGFDIDRRRIADLRDGVDHTGECDRETLAASDVEYTADPDRLREANFHVVTVPTPVDDAKQPDLSALRSAARTLGERLAPGSIVVFESTVYPGATEEVCVPLLERHSGLRWRRDFHVAYSPERINPGDREHTLENVVKVVAADDAATLDTVAAMYERVVHRGVHRASSIRVAEAAKVIENTQRDINIALMNELAVIFDRMGIDSGEVLAAAGTKWNFLPFRPGLVGGHCIGVDPYYLTYKASLLGYHPRIILAGRQINDGMGQYVATQAVKQLVRLGHRVRDARVTVLGLTFKENVPDLRNTRVVDIVRELSEYGARVQIHDPVAPREAIAREYGRPATALEDLEPADCIVLAVGHRSYAEQGWRLVRRLLRGVNPVVVDVKGILPREEAPEGVALWRL